MPDTIGDQVETLVTAFVIEARELPTWLRMPAEALAALSKPHAVVLDPVYAAYRVVPMDPTEYARLVFLTKPKTTMQTRWCALDVVEPGPWAVGNSMKVLRRLRDA